MSAKQKETNEAVARAQQKEREAIAGSGSRKRAGDPRAKDLAKTTGELERARRNFSASRRTGASRAKLRGREVAGDRDQQDAGGHGFAGAGQQGRERPPTVALEAADAVYDARIATATAMTIAQTTANAHLATQLQIQAYESEIYVFIYLFLK